MAMDTEHMKEAAARAALPYVDSLSLIGVGTGSTVAHFIELLGSSGHPPQAAVATSADTRQRLTRAGVQVVSLNDVGRPPVYVDGADEIDPLGRTIKGGGGAHAMEKIVASASRVFVCIVDASKVVARLGETVPIPLEILPEARSLVRDAIGTLGGKMTVRMAASEAGNLLADVTGLDLSRPEQLELELDAIPGVIECGIFARRLADVVIVGEADGSVRIWSPAHASR